MKRSPKKPSSPSLPAAPTGIVLDKLTTDIRALIEQSTWQAARQVNSTLALLKWTIGKRIRQDIWGDQRAAYGEQVLENLAATLTHEYGRGYTKGALSRMVSFGERFPKQKIVATLSQQLTWSHWIELIAVDDPLAREFYALMCSHDRWSVRTLRGRIGSLLFERTALSRKPDQLAQQELAMLRDEDRMSPDLVFRDPYLLDFLDLQDVYVESDLEAGIIRELERFILELGSDFCFVTRQKRMSIGKKDFYLDLLFYHRTLRRLVAIELKFGAFTAEHMGQMELYLRWLNRYERKPGEESPLGLILCAEADQEQIELLELDQSSIRVAEYLTALLPRPLLQARFHEAVRRARSKFGSAPEERPIRTRKKPSKSSTS